MRLLLYYISHTFVNSIKKIFRTWVIIFIAVMIAFGALAGVGAAFFADHVVGNEEQMEEVSEAEMADEEAESEHVKPLREVFEEMDEADRIFTCRIIADVVFAICLAALMFNIYGARKGGTEIFTMADVNFLFTAPMRPQSVLLYKTVLQMGIILAGSIYFVFQIPNLVLNGGLSAGHIVLVFVVLLIVLVTCKLASILVYTITATNTSLRKYIQPLVYSMVLILVAVVAFYKQFVYEDLFSTLYNVFSTRVAMAIPFVGWTAGMVYSLLMKEYVAGVIYTLLILAGFLGVIFLIWKLKADFYEDALTNANTMQEKVEGVKAGIQTNVKRSKKLKREGDIGKGEGANTFFYKYMHNRKRFAYLGVITNSMAVYGAIVLTMGVMGLALEVEYNIHVIGGILLAAVFFRSYVSPMQAECKQNYIYLVPESPYKKIGSLMGAELAELSLDLIPAIVMMKLFFDTTVLQVVLWILVIVSFSFILTAVSLFIDMILPESLPNEIQSIFIIFGKFVGVLPMAIAVVVLSVLNMLPFAFVLSLVCNVAIGVLLTAISAALLHVGRR